MPSLRPTHSSLDCETSSFPCWSMLSHTFWGRHPAGHQPPKSCHQGHRQKPGSHAIQSCSKTCKVKVVNTGLQCHWKGMKRPQNFVNVCSRDSSACELNAFLWYLTFLTRKSRINWSSTTLSICWELPLLKRYQDFDLRGDQDRTARAWNAGSRPTLKSDVNHSNHKESFESLVEGHCCVFVLIHQILFTSFPCKNSVFFRADATACSLMPIILRSPRTLALKLPTGACEAQKELKDDGSVEEVAGEQHLIVKNVKSNGKFANETENETDRNDINVKNKIDHLQNQKIYESMMYIKTDLASALWDRNWEDGNQQQAPVQWGSVKLNLCKNTLTKSIKIHLLTPQNKKAHCESWILHACFLVLQVMLEGVKLQQQREVFLLDFWLTHSLSFWLAAWHRWGEAQAKPEPR